MRWANRPQPFLVRSLQQIDPVNGIRAFEAQNVTYWSTAFRFGPPKLRVPVKSRSILDLRHFPGAFHRAIPRKLPLALCPGLFRAVPAREPILRFDVACYLRRDAKA